MDVGILGPLVVRQGGREVTIVAAKPRALFTLLVLARGSVLSSETLVDTLWEGCPPATASKILQGYVSQLRKAVGDRELETHQGGYRLRIEPDEVDSDRFEALLGRGQALLRTGDAQAAAPLLRQALALWRGPALAEFRYAEFAATESRRLEELRLLALECRFQSELALGHHAEMVPELEVLVRDHPLRENLCGLLMLALYRSGRQADALGVHRSVRRALVDDLGIGPGEPLQRLEAAILAHDPALEPPDRPGSDPDLGPAREQTSGRMAASPPGTPAGAADQLITPPDGPSQPSSPGPALGTQPTAARPIVHAQAPTTDRRHHRHVLLAALALIGVVGLPPWEDTSSHPATLAVSSVGFVDAHGDRLSRQVQLPGSPTALAVGDGAVWAVLGAGNTVARIDPDSNAVVRTIPVGLEPTGIAVGGGSIWVANHGDNTVSRISPETNAVVQTIAVGVGPVAVAVGYGSVWVTNAGDRTLTRIDQSTGVMTGTVRTNTLGRGIAVGGGDVWVSDEASNRVLAIDPRTDAVAATVTVGTGPTGVAYGGGAVWVVNALDGTLSRLDPTTLTVRSTTPVAGGPAAVTFAAGSVWVAAELGSRVDRIDPTSGGVTASTVVGNGPVGLGAAGEGAWVAVQAAGTGHRGGRLVVFGDAVNSVDPAGEDLFDIFPGLAEPAYDGLTSLRATKGGPAQVVPDLALAMPQPTDGGTTYTFRLRPEVRYSDGRPLQAGDFRRALQRLLTLNPGIAGSFGHVLGVADCLRRPAGCDLSRGLLVDKTSVTFRLDAPDPRLPEHLSLLVPVPPGTSTRDVGTTPLPGTGPYAIRSFAPGRLVLFERNPYFHIWSRAARPDGYPDEIVYRVEPNQGSAVRQVAAGRGDLAFLDTSPPTLATLAAQHPSQVHLVDQQALIWVFLNVAEPPFDDVRVRRALNFAVDRARVAGLYGADLAQPACQVVPPTVPGYRPYCPYTVNPSTGGNWTAPDLARARSLVAASGTRGQAVTLWTFPDFVASARYMVGLLGDLGYRAKLHEVDDAATYFQALNATPGAQAGIYGWFGIPLAVDLLSSLTCTNDPNPAHFCDPRIDAQIAQLARTEPVDPSGTAGLAASIDREITDQAPWVPLFTPRWAYTTSARVGNYQTNDGQVRLDQIWVQ